MSAFHRVLAHFLLRLDGIVAGETGGAVVAWWLRHAVQHTFHTEIADRIDAEELSHIIQCAVGSEKFAWCGEVNPVVTGMEVGRARDTQVDFSGPRLTQMTHLSFCSSAANNRVVHNDNSLATNCLANYVELDLYALCSYAGFGTDECAADIRISHKAEVEPYS